MTVSLKTVTPHLRSIVPNVQRHMAYFAPPSLLLFAPLPQSRSRSHRPVPLTRSRLHAKQSFVVDLHLLRHPYQLLRRGKARSIHTHTHTSTVNQGRVERGRNRKGRRRGSTKEDHSRLLDRCKRREQCWRRANPDPKPQLPSPKP